MRIRYEDTKVGKVCVHTTSLNNKFKRYVMKPYAVFEKGIKVQSGIFCPKDNSNIIQFRMNS